MVISSTFVSAIVFASNYLYGILMGLTPLVGEWLFQNIQVPHHGYPVTFSIVCAVILLTSLALFIQTWQLPVVHLDPSDK